MPSETLNDDVKTKIEKIISGHDVVLFMKGNKGFPKCGFSKKVVDILTEMDVEFADFDILENEEIRHGLKIYSEWPTFPQLYVKGQLIGGCDIVEDMYAAGELAEIFN